MMYGDTHYYGIWVQKDEGHFWICDAHGGDEYIGTTAPTAAQIDCYRAQIS